LGGTETVDKRKVQKSDDEEAAVYHIYPISPEPGSGADIFWFWKILLRHKRAFISSHLLDLYHVSLTSH